MLSDLLFRDRVEMGSDVDASNSLRTLTGLSKLGGCMFFRFGNLFRVCLDRGPKILRGMTMNEKLIVTVAIPAEAMAGADANWVLRSVAAAYFGFTKVLCEQAHWAPRRPVQRTRHWPKFARERKTHETAPAPFCVEVVL